MNNAIGYYGKIPSYDDFIKTDASSKEIIQYRAWLDSSFDALIKTLELDKVISFSLFLYYKDFDLPLISYWMSSNDNSRVAPFSIYAETLKESYKNIGLIAEAYSTFLGRCRWNMKYSAGSFSLAMQQNTLWTLREMMPKDFSQASIKYKSFLSNRTQLDLSSQLYNDDQEEQFKFLLLNILLALHLSDFRNPEKLKAIFKFPLGSRVGENSMLIALWIEICSMFIKFEDIYASLCWSDEYFYIIFGGIDDNLLINLYNPVEDNHRIWDFQKMSLFENPITNKYNNIIDESFNNENMVVNDLLNNIKKADVEHE